MGLGAVVGFGLVALGSELVEGFGWGLVVFGHGEGGVGGADGGEGHGVGSWLARRLGRRAGLGYQ